MQAEVEQGDESANHDASSEALPEMVGASESALIDDGNPLRVVQVVGHVSRTGQALEKVSVDKSTEGLGVERVLLVLFGINATLAIWAVCLVGAMLLVRP